MREKNIKIKNIPKHIAIIFDGNRRWAKKRFLPVKFGHKAGSDNLAKILNAAHNYGVEFVTAYVFSTENWKRNKEEINDLMKLFDNYLDEQINKGGDGNYRLDYIGNIFGLDNSLREKILKLKDITKNRNGLTFLIAINYGSRDEILRAIKKIYDQKNLDINNFDEKNFEKFLDTYKIPDPDLLIRTGGDLRLSNFLLWQCAYTEFYFCKKLWPDFNSKDLETAILSFSQRKRNFGN
ncbi:MAG: di-trans,poly-cis-decaprenylcistransferase [Clostridiales bacterium]|nr:di-trans,poly-cis-decaprenylcistransferase [Clostridiales bacterium]